MKVTIRPAVPADAGAATETGLSFLLPTRQAGLFRWCLSRGLRVVKPMTLMAMGEYREPRGSFYPSVATERAEAVSAQGRKVFRM